jgi:hypothetical protein
MELIITEASEFALSRQRLTGDKGSEKFSKQRFLMQDMCEHNKNYFFMTF